MYAKPSLSLSSDRMSAHDGLVPSLDGLRAFSIMVVLVGHFVLARNLLGVSAFGVLVFFFISGFLISRLLYSEQRANGEINLKDFYIRRVIRLYPVLCVFMVLSIAIACWRGLHFSLIEVFSVFGYFANYLISWRDTHGFFALPGEHNVLPIGVLWSLSVEEHFYLLMPFLVPLIKGNPVRMLQIMAAICVSCVLIRIFYALEFHQTIGLLGIYKRSETRFDAIGFGVLMSTLCQLPEGRAFLTKIANPAAFSMAFGALLLSFALRNELFESTIRYTIQSAALFPIFATVLFSERIRWANVALNSPPVVWIGKLSYSLYVWHGGILFFFAAAILACPTSLKPFAEFGFTFACACLSYYLVERPFLGLRAYLKPRKRVEPLRWFYGDRP